MPPSCAIWHGCALRAGRSCLLIKDAPGLERVEILRYHKTAGAKYAMIGRTYAPGFDTGAEPRVHDVFSDYNLKTLIQ